ncbi:MAG: tryptophan synthase subunit alpha [Chloroflexi bacterium]|nr:tryptophan synthase subunit alpha [Chloroflexota bacterium]
MSQIAAVFEQANHKALIPYVTVGYPSIEATLKVVPLLAQSGADIIELGIPFSDPLADGVTIQNASYMALQQGVTPKLCLETAKKLHNQVKTPLVFMTYYNPILSYGLDKFCCACREAGVSGLIIPDLPPEEGAELEACACHEDIDVIYLLAPTSTEERTRLVAERSRGFVYLVSLTGVTGARSKLPADISEFVSRVRRLSRQPLCVGFGIATAEQARQVAQLADGVIVGSKIIQLMEADPSLGTVASFVKELREAVDR